MSIRLRTITCTLDGEDCIEEVCYRKGFQHGICVMHGRVREHKFSSRQTTQRRPQQRFSHDHVCEIGELVCVPQKMGWIRRVMAHQTQQSGAVALPVSLPQFARRSCVESEY